MENIAFSVLLPVYHGNTADEFAVALNSILKQTLPANEVVIVQDGPVNDAITAQLQQLSSYPDIKIIRLPENLGIGPALNEGLKHCTCGWVARMDADDIAIPQRFEKTMQWLHTQSPRPDLVGAYYAEWQPGKKEFIRNVPLLFSKILAFSKYRNPHSHPTVFYRKAAVMEAGGYKNYFFAEDWYLWLRMFKKGFTSANMPEVLVYTETRNYSRRLGARALKNDYLLFINLYKERLIGLHHLLANLLVRTVVRLLPTTLAYSFYQKILRRAAKN